MTDDEKGGKYLSIPKIEMSETIVFLDRDSLIKSSRQFDADWYASTYQDVAMLNMGPLEHYWRSAKPLADSPIPDLTRNFIMITTISGIPQAAP